MQGGYAPTRKPRKQPPHLPRRSQPRGDEVHPARTPSLADWRFALHEVFTYTHQAFSHPTPIGPGNDHLLSTRRSFSLRQVLLSRLHATAANASAVCSAAARQKRLHDRSRNRTAGGTSTTAGGAGGGDEDPSFRSDSPFPWAAALVAAVCGVVYYKVSNVVAVGMFVPIVNGVFMVCLAVFAFHKLKEKGAFEGGHGKRGRQRQRYRQQQRAAAGGVVRKGGAWRRRRRHGGGGGGAGGSTYLFG